MIPRNLDARRFHYVVKLKPRSSLGSTVRPLDDVSASELAREPGFRIPSAEFRFGTLVFWLSLSSPRGLKLRLSWRARSPARGNGLGLGGD